MQQNNLHFGDIVYINLNENVLLADPAVTRPFFVPTVESSKNAFRNCLFQLLSASPDPIPSNDFIRLFSPSFPRHCEASK